MSKTLCDIVAEFVDKPPGEIRGIVIHLRRATERNVLVKNLIKSVGTLTVWDAADGMALISEGHPTACGMDRGVVRTAGEVGCMVSHVSAYRKALADGISYLVVFEDDCVAVPGFSLDGVQNYLRKVKEFRADFSITKMNDLVLLGTCGCYRWKELKNGLKATDHFNGSHAYIIGREMMEKIIEAYEYFLKMGQTVPIDGILPLLLQISREHVFCPENDTGFFRQNRDIPSYICSHGNEKRKD
jgi:GR25 family glycosyltransferase involved in LPS biosynthesis